MRIVILCSSPYSETGCAVAARLAKLGHVPVGALTLPSSDPRTLLRKIGQWGFRDSFRYATAKLSPGRFTEQVRNPYLENSLRHGDGVFRDLREVASSYGFPVATCRDQNSPQAVAQLKQWSSDVAIFTGGNILRTEIFKVPRFGVVNSHLALLPEIRGMSSPEWSILCDVPLGITIHFMDTGIDTGPILLRRDFARPATCDSFTDLRNRMIADGIELIAEAVAGLESGQLVGEPQPDREKYTQFFVMHERLKLVAARRMNQPRLNSVAGACNSSGGHDG
jgi:folate-dependent phosphoribosylglycinamide formyltransferase PurN